jgi:hypothetical protein
MTSSLLKLQVDIKTHSCKKKWSDVRPDERLTSDVRRQPHPRFASVMYGCETSGLLSIEKGRVKKKNYI